MNQTPTNDPNDLVKNASVNPKEKIEVVKSYASASNLITPDNCSPSLRIKALTYSRTSSRSSAISSVLAESRSEHSRFGSSVNILSGCSDTASIQDESAGSQTDSYCTDAQEKSISVLQHMHKHASTFGLDTSSLFSGNSRSQENNLENKEMSTQGDNILHQGPAFLSWRKLHLSKAKLKAASNTSALLAGFAMVAVVEIQLNGNGSNSNGTNVTLPKPLLILFAVCTTLLVAVHMLALLISTCILPNMEAISNLHSLSLVHESPHEKMHMYIELAWGCSTVLGILLFMIEVIILCWIQFYNVLESAAYVATAILVPFLVLFIWFAIIFYRNLVAHSYETRKSQIEELKHVLEMGDELNNRELNGQMLHIV